ncbi:MAG: TetR/AcrR family transcriptional regulator [Bacteroidales bacterium]|nr:TetR/AcrR family transcriptional regulator [Bacteroidales bacterium]
MKNNDDILEQVGCLFNKFGIKSVTMDDISREMGISKKTLYQFVSDKDDLVAKAVAHDFNRAIAARDQTIGNSKDAIEQLIRLQLWINIKIKHYSHAIEYDLKKYYPAVFAELKSRKRESMFNMFYGNILRGKKEEIYRNNIKEEIIAKLFVYTIDSIADNQVISIEEFVSNQFHKEIIEYHIRGIANKKGISLLENYLLNEEFNPEMNNN